MNVGGSNSNSPSHNIQGFFSKAQADLEIEKANIEVPVANRTPKFGSGGIFMSDSNGGANTSTKIAGTSGDGASSIVNKKANAPGLNAKSAKAQTSSSSRNPTSGAMAAGSGGINAQNCANGPANNSKIKSDLLTASRLRAGTQPLTDAALGRLLLSDESMEARRRIQNNG